MPDFSFERKAGAGQGRIVVGIDEAGRGPLAGPVVAAAVQLEAKRLPRSLRVRIDDSKKLAPELRENIYERLQAYAKIGVGMASCIEIDRINILRASLLAMRRALDALGLPPDHALIDGNVCPDLPCPATMIVEGDGKCLSIAAASIIAKVVRDRVMCAMAVHHPNYGWEHNAGYSTPEHIGALARFGPCLQHRRSFYSVRKHLLVRA
jgi:ribonuclease HII